MSMTGPRSRTIPSRCRRSRHRTIVPHLVVVLFLGLVLPSHAGTIRRVPSEYPTIQQAVTAAETGDSILIAPGTYTGEYNRGTSVNQVLFIRGEGGAGAVIIDAENVSTGISFTSISAPAPLLQGVTVRHGNPYGVYIYDASPLILDCSIEDCASGIALFKYNGQMLGTTVNGCSANGVKITTGSVCDIRNCEIYDNGDGYGAGVQVINASPTFANCSIRGNSTTSSDGGVYAESSTVTLSDVIVSGNHATDLGGGIRLWQATLNLSYTTVSRNSAGTSGGGVSSYQSTVDFDHSILWGNCTATAGYEMQVDSGSSAHFDCSAVDQAGIINDGGSIVYETSTILTDPLFCDMGSCADVPTTDGDFHLALASPCVGGPCGYVGHFNAACGETPILPKSWGWIRASFR